MNMIYIDNPVGTGMIIFYILETYNDYYGFKLEFEYI